MNSPSQASRCGFTIHRLRAVVLFLALRMWAGPGDPDPDFRVPPVAGGFPTTVSAVVLQPDGKILLGGNFTAGYVYGGSALRGALAIGVQPDGYILAGGGTVPTTSGYVRLQPTGRADVSFMRNANGVVEALAFGADGRAYIAGDFTTFAGHPCAGLVRLQSNGQLDTGFNPAAVAGLSTPVVALQDDGAILVGGASTDGRPLIRLLGGDALEAAPVVVAQPSAQRLTVGQSVAVRALVSSTRPFTCAWSLNGASLNAATEATLTLTNLAVTQAGTYTVTVSNAHGTTAASALLEVVALPASVGRLDPSYNTRTRPQVMDGFFAVALSITPSMRG